MSVMRHRVVRLCAICFYAWYFFALPASWSLGRGDTPQSCSCPMCRTLGGSAHCDCCDAGKCTCHMTTGKDDGQVVLVVEPALLPSPGVYGVLLPSVALEELAQHKTPIPDLAIPTPPPKA